MPAPPVDDGDGDTVSVSATVLRVRRVEQGRLLALASVEILIAGVSFLVHGVRIIKTGPRSKGVAAPRCRLAGGALADAIELPPELSAAIAGVVLDEYEALSRRPDNAQGYPTISDGMPIKPG